jgi:hypothetical protein
MNIIDVTTAPATPGIYRGLSNEAYHAGPGVSKSQLDVLARSPFHYYCHYVTEEPVKRPEATASMQLGTAIHAAILEPELFARWVIMPDVDGRTKEGKAAKLAAIELATHMGVPTIAADLRDQVRDIAESVMSHHDLNQYMRAEGHAELSVYWKDEDTGILCRCRPDWLTLGTVLDLKSTQDASPRAFQRSAYGWRYWVQAAFYTDGLAAHGLDGDFIFAAIETKPPYACAGYVASRELIEAGRREYKRLLRLLKHCHEEQTWPGYEGLQGGMRLLDLPGFANERLTDLDDEIFDPDNAVASFDEAL